MAAEAIASGGVEQRISLEVIGLRLPVELALQVEAGGEPGVERSAGVAGGEVDAVGRDVGAVEVDIDLAILVAVGLPAGAGIGRADAQPVDRSPGVD